MWGMLLIGLLIEVWDLVTELWPVLVAILVLYALWQWIALPAWDRRALAVRDQRRHEQARREIDRIALEASRGMYDAALKPREVIEGTAAEVKRR